MQKIDQIRFYGDGNINNYPAGITQAQLSNIDQGIFNRFVHMLNICVEAPQGTIMHIFRTIKIYNEYREVETQEIHEQCLIHSFQKYECNYPIRTCKISCTNPNGTNPLIVTFTYEEIEEEEEDEKNL